MPITEAFAVPAAILFTASDMVLVGPPLSDKIPRLGLPVRFAIPEVIVAPVIFPIKE